MSANRIALKLNGDVDLDEYTKAINSFTDLVRALTEEVSEQEIIWSLSDLGYGSAYAEIKGYASIMDPVERVISAYFVVANAMRNNEPIPYSYAVVDPARKLASVIGGKITSIAMTAGDKIATTILQPIEKQISRAVKVRALDTLSGQVETLQRRRSSFMLYDSLFDLPIPCYVDEELMEDLRQAWGKSVIVTGDVIRDAETGKPLEIRNVRNIEVRTPPPPDALYRARGVLAHLAPTTLPEQRIQELRHAIN